MMGGGLEKVSDKSNRRDKNWTMQFDYVSDLDIPTKEPTTRAFPPRGLKPAEKQPDGKLFLRQRGPMILVSPTTTAISGSPVLQDSQAVPPRRQRLRDSARGNPTRSFRSNPTLKP